MSGTANDSTTLAYGLTSGGFVRMRLPEVRRSIFDALNAATGEVFDETPNSFMGQVVNVFAEREAALWELLEQVYLSAFPVTAFGQSLDLAVSYSGVRRLQETPSRVGVILFGAQGTIIPPGAIIESTSLPEGFTRNPQFRIVAGVAITRDDIAHIELAIPATVTLNRQYSLTFNGTNHITAAGNGETPQAIAQRLATSIASAGAEASASNGIITVTGPVPFRMSWSDTVSLLRLGTPGIAEALDGGAVPVPINALTRIITPVGGWDTVTNRFPATLGTAREDDAALRARYASGVFRLGAGVLPSIDANIRNDVPGVLFAKTYENNTDVTDSDGRPPHSIELIAEGGDSAAIGVRLFTLKGAGIRSFGTTVVEVMDVDGFKHQVFFNRPIPVYVFARVQVVPDTEAPVPGNLDDQVKQAVAAYGDTLTVGENVNVHQIIAHVMRKGADGEPVIPGIRRLNITLGARSTINATPPAPSEYLADDMAINLRQRAILIAQNVTVFR